MQATGALLSVRQMMAGRLKAALLLAVGAALFGAVAPQAQASAIVSNGTVALGVVDSGNLNTFDPTRGRDVGVTFVPTDNDGTQAGCSCEGWGAGNFTGDVFRGKANNSQAIDVTQVSFTSTATTATSVTSIDGKLEVTHDFKPFAGSPNLYQIDVTLKNIGAAALPDVRYTRGMDWDIEPTPFDEYVTIQRGTSSDLLYSDDNGFADTYPDGGRGPIVAGTANADVTDSGPADHGAIFDFGFGNLDVGDEKKFTLFYGAAANEADANAAVSAAALEVYSLGQPTSSDPTVGTPNTFIWGFRAVGGTPVIPPTLTLSPKTATNTVGDPHTVTATLTSSGGDPVPGAKIVFIVTGANPGGPTSSLTNASGQATFTYTGTSAGDDTIRACLDTNDNNACEPGEPTDTAAKTYVAGPPAGVNGRMVSNAKRGGATFASNIDCPKEVANARSRPFTIQWAGNTFKLSSVLSVACTDDPSFTPSPPPATMTFDTQDGTGAGKVNGVAGYTLLWHLEDRGAPNPGDRARLRITRDSDSSVVLDVPLGTLTSGQNFALPPI